MTPPNGVLPRLALVHDRPPTWQGGGPVLLRRLFEGYPSDTLIYISAFSEPGSSPSPWLTQEYAMTQAYAMNRGMGLRRTKPVGSVVRRLGLGRVRLFWQCLPGSGYVRRLRALFQQHRVAVVHAIAQQFLWISAWYAARPLGIRYVLAVHDHWPSTVQHHLPPAFTRPLFGYFLRQADAIMGSHEEVGAILRDQYGVAMTGVEVDGLTASERAGVVTRWAERRSVGSCLRVGYAGMSGAYQPEFARLRDALRLYTERTGRAFKLVTCAEQPREAWTDTGWGADELEYRGWLAYDDVQTVLEGCDILFLPMSFDPAKADLMRWGQPSKTPSYLRCGRPILVHAPAYSSIAKLASNYHIGALVTEPDAGSLCTRLVQMTEDVSLVERMPAEAVRCLADRFDIDRIRAHVWETVAIRTDPPVGPAGR